jgi:N utilization substance protein B
MLNRRILRVKAMQALYSYYQAKNANEDVVLDEIAAIFAPDPNTMTPKDPKEQALLKNLSVRYFHKLLDADKLVFESDTPEEVRKTVGDAIASYRNSVRKDEGHYKKLMVREVEKLYERFLKVLMLPHEFAKLNNAEMERNTKRHIKDIELEGTYNLSKNVVIKNLAEDNALSNEAIKLNANWRSEEDNLKSWYKNVLKEDEVYKAYIDNNKPSAKDDLDILNHIYRQIIFKDKEITMFFELWDISWSENKDIVKGMIKKTLKSYNPEAAIKFELLELALNWEEDKEYFETLYSATVDQQKNYEKSIAEKSKNWDIDRISVTDRIIIEMALAEMINFPSIPVKVSINEYIELSKNYSTPKSKQFVNGMLDALAIELKEKGIIKKSGRGLLDNQ